MISSSCATAVLLLRRMPEGVRNKSLYFASTPLFPSYPPRAVSLITGTYCNYSNRSIVPPSSSSVALSLGMKGVTMVRVVAAEKTNNRQGKRVRVPKKARNERD